jgi:hypothetical protein
MEWQRAHGYDPNKRETRALCHPDRPHAAHGWCNSCYQYKAKGTVHPSYERYVRRPECHPDRKHEALGLCARCYSRMHKQRYTYGLTPEGILAMAHAQGKVCAICQTPLDIFGFRGYAIDHDHASGKVRGLLCDNCNAALGRWRDDAMILKRAIAYLEAANGAPAG